MERDQVWGAEMGERLRGILQRRQRDDTRRGKGEAIMMSWYSGRMRAKF